MKTTMATGKETDKGTAMAMEMGEDKNMPHRPGIARWGVSGFTLLELLVVSALMIIVVMGTAQLWRYLSLQISNINQRATTVQEMDFALEYLRRDLCSPQWALPVEESRLILCQRAPDGSDRLVEYTREGTVLVRSDQSTGISVPVAKISEFTVDNVGVSTLRIMVTVTSGTISRRVTLLWTST